jgi:hypothetical protein
LQCQRRWIRSDFFCDAVGAGKRRDARTLPMATVFVTLSWAYLFDRKSSLQRN